MIDRAERNYTSLSSQQYNQFVTPPQTYDLVPELVATAS